MSSIQNITRMIQSRQFSELTREQVIDLLKAKHAYREEYSNWSMGLGLIYVAEYAVMTLPQLRKEAKSLGLPTTGIRKAQLIYNILDATPTPPITNILEDIVEAAELYRQRFEEMVLDEEDFIRSQLEEAIVANEEEQLAERQEAFIEQLASLNRGEITEIPEVYYAQLGGLQRVIEMITQNVYDQKPFIEYLVDGTEKSVPISADTAANLAATATGVETDEKITEFYEDLSTAISRVPFINIYIATAAGTYNNRGGAFFKYTHKLPISLKKLGIYKKVESKNYKANCFYKALETLDLPENKLKTLRTMIKGHTITTKNIGTVCERLSIKIIVTIPFNNGKTRTITYGRKNRNTYKMGLIDEHYFAKIGLPITMFSLKHYEEVRNVSQWYKIRQRRPNGKNPWKKINKPSTDSFKVVKFLMDHKETFLDKITKYSDIYKTPLQSLTKDDDLEIVVNEMDTFVYLADGDEFPTELFDTNIVIRGKGKKQEEFVTIFFDVETENSEEHTGWKHLPYCVCYYDPITGKTHSFRGRDCCKKMLDHIRYPNICLYAHNCGYDFRFIFQYISVHGYLPKGNSLVTASGTYGNKNIIFRDTHRMISVPLSKFGGMFGLKQEKEVMPHRLYDGTILQNPIKPIKEALELLKEEEHEQFLQNIERFNLRVGKDKYHALSYAIEYCKIDCIVMYQGFSKFREWMYEVTGLNINQILSQASVADKFVKYKGCYDGVHGLSGHARGFIQKTVVGGRCMMAENKKQLPKDILINDFDACSLYPSAMQRLGGEIGGFLKGAPKPITADKLNMEFLNQTDGYFVLAKITNVGIHRRFPVLSVVREGIRYFTNNLVGEEVYIDKITLEDAINFQQVEFELISGVYFDQGRNPLIKDVIETLYNKRLEMKRQKNPIQSIYKLLMNSSYGKSILKPVNTQDIIVNNEEEKARIMDKKYYHIKEMTKLTNDKYHFKLANSINDHVNYAQVGAEVLSMSKRIMNEVMCLAEDLNLNIYYTDTDSIHIADADVPKLGDAFKVRYGRELIGKSMGNFHCDFELNGADDVVSTRFIALGKKVYLDVLEGVDKDGNIIKGHHIRCKGVPSQAVELAAKDRGMTLVELYEYMYEGNPITFDLTCGGNKCVFKGGADLSISSVNTFTRTLKF